MKIIIKPLLTFWLITLLSFFSINTCLADITDPTTQDVINIINSNDRLSHYFGGPIKADNITQEKSYSVSMQDGSITKTFTLKITGTKHEATATVAVVKTKFGIGTMDLALTDPSGAKQVFIDLRINTNVLTTEELAKKSTLYFFEEILNKVEAEYSNFHLTRSGENNDYMQVGTLKVDNKPCLFLEYSEGFTAENKQIYRADGACQTKSDVLKELYSYASGSDNFKKDMKWKQVKKIEKGQYIFN